MMSISKNPSQKKNTLQFKGKSKPLRHVSLAPPEVYDWVGSKFWTKPALASVFTCSDKQKLSLTFLS